MKKKNNIYIALKFGIVGLSNTLISYLAFLLFFKIFSIAYILSSICAYFTGLLNSYFWNLRWTFKKRHSRDVLFKFIIVNIVSLGSKVLIVYFMVEYLQYSELVSELIAMSFAIVLNFVGNNFWTFNF